jgi:glycosyltransferase involved in cell wall biosynthesis
VVASDVGGLGNLMIPGFNGYVVKADAEQLASAVEAALSDYENYAKLANNCLRMRDTFSRKHWREQIIAILREAGGLCADRPTSRCEGGATRTTAGRA